MKYILLKILAYDCGQEYELDDYEVLLSVDDSAEESIKSIIEEWLLNFYDINELPTDTVHQLSQYRLSDDTTVLFEVDSEHHNLEHMEMVHIEVSWKYVEVYSKDMGGVLIC